MLGKVPLLIRIIHPTYGFYIRKHLHTVLADEGIDISQGPYLLLSNHVGAYDPIIISIALQRHVRWVAGAYLFKLGLLRLILEKGATAIPKQQGRSDLTSLKAMQNALKDGEIVGIFPEGTRTWDGDMVDLDYRALAKMIRIFRCPVLFVHLEGGYAECPRWADVPRKGGTITVRFKGTLSAEEVGSLPLPVLAETLEKNLRFSNDEWKKTASYGWRSPRQAEGLQRSLYLCPCCRSVGSLRTQGTALTCSVCSATGTLTEKDDIVSSAFFPTVAEWHRWERKEIPSFSDFPEEKGVLFQTGDADNNGKLETVSKDITVSLADSVLFVRDNGSGKVWNLPLSEITSFIINAKQTMELFHQGVLYRIRLLPDASSLKYLERWQGRGTKE